MSSYDVTQVGKPSIKDHPYYAEMTTALLLGFGFLGPELTAAAAIAFHGWLSWEKTTTGSGYIITRPILPLKSAIQDGPLNVHTGLSSSLDVPSSSSDQLDPEIVESEQDGKNCDDVTKQLKAKVSELEEKFLLAQCELQFSQTRLDEQDKSEQKARARAVEVEKKNGALNNLLGNRLAEIRDLKTEMRALQAQTASVPFPFAGRTLRHPQDLQAKFTRCHEFNRGQNLEGLPVEIEQQLLNAKYRGFTLEAEQGDVQYILVDIQEPQSVYCLPLHNQILFTMGGDRPTGYALQPGVTMDDILPEVQDHFRYEVEFGGMFSRCIVRSTKPLVNVEFDYTMHRSDREFPLSMEEHLECQNMTDVQLDTLAPLARHHRKHLGLKASLLIVNKQCSPWAALRACDELPVVDGYAGEHSLVRNGDRNCWDFHVLHISQGERVELLVDDVAAYLAEAQPWHDYEQEFLSDGKWDTHPVIPETYLLSNEHVKELGFIRRLTRQPDGQNWITPICPEWIHLQPKWEASKQRPTELQHPVRDAIDPVHFYREAMNIEVVQNYVPEDEMRDLQVAIDWAQVCFGSESEHNLCHCEYAEPASMCCHCNLKFLKFDGLVEEREQSCQDWLDSLPYEYTGCAQNGEDTYTWAGEKWLNSFLHEYVGCSVSGVCIFEWTGEIAFKNAGTLYTEEHEVSFMGLEATSDAVPSDEEMPLPVGPWTGKSETIKGRYIRGGHLMIDASRIEWVRIFPLTGHYMVRAKVFNKIQRFGMPGKQYKEIDPGWMEFCHQKEALTSKIEHSDVGAVIHTRTLVDKMIIDYSLPFVMEEPVRYDITMGQAYDDFDFQELCHLDENQVAQFLPMFWDGHNDFYDKVGRIETLCPWRFKFFDDNGKATIPAPRTYKVVHPQRPRNPNKPRKQGPKPKTTNGDLNPIATAWESTYARLAKEAPLSSYDQAPSLTSVSSSDRSDSQPSTPEPTFTISGPWK